MLQKIHKLYSHFLRVALYLSLPWWYHYLVKPCMTILMYLFGEGKELNTLQICDRGIVIFFLSLVLIRISGRRSFGIRTPLDNIIVILLGALLSRAIVGATPFAAVVATSFIIVLLHRSLAWLIMHNKLFSRIIEGDKILLYRNGSFIHGNIKKALVCQEDIMQGIRQAALTDDLDKIDAVYIERSGEITVIQKTQ